MVYVKVNASCMSSGQLLILPVVPTSSCCQSHGPPSAAQFYGQSVVVLSTKKSETTLARWMSPVEID